MIVDVKIYGDPKEHPQKETYWGNVNPIGPRACYDEGKRCLNVLVFRLTLLLWCIVLRRRCATVTTSKEAWMCALQEFLTLMGPVCARIFFAALKHMRVCVYFRNEFGRWTRRLKFHQTSTHPYLDCIPICMVHTGAEERKHHRLWRRPSKTVHSSTAKWRDADL